MSKCFITPVGFRGVWFSHEQKPHEPLVALIATSQVMRDCRKYSAMFGPEIHLLSSLYEWTGRDWVNGESGLKLRVKEFWWTPENFIVADLVSEFGEGA